MEDKLEWALTTALARAESAEAALGDAAARLAALVEAVQKIRDIGRRANPYDQCAEIADVALAAAKGAW